MVFKSDCNMNIYAGLPWLARDSRKLPVIDQWFDTVWAKEDALRISGDDRVEGETGG